MNILSLFWSKTVGVVMAVVGVLVALASIRHSIRRKAKEEMRGEIRERTIERIGVASDNDRDVVDMSDAAVSDELRRQGWLRD